MSDDDGEVVVVSSAAAGRRSTSPRQPLLSHRSDSAPRSRNRSTSLQDPTSETDFDQQAVRSADTEVDADEGASRGEASPPERWPTILHTLLSAIKSNIGIGILTMPVAFSMGGPAAALPMLLLCSAGTIFATTMISSALATVDGRSTPRSLAALGVACTKRAFVGTITNGFMLAAMGGACLAYASFLVSASLQVLPLLLRHEPPSRNLLALAVAVLLAPLGLPHTLSGPIRKIAAGGVFAVFVALVGFVVSMASGPGGLAPPHALHWEVRPSGIAETFGIFAFVNEGAIALAVPLYAEMPRNGGAARQRTFVPILSTSIGVVTCLNILVGLVGLASWHSNAAIPSTIADQLDPGKPMHALILLLLAVQVAATFAQVAFVVLTSLPSVPDFFVTRVGVTPSLARAVYRCSIVFAMALLGGSIEKLAALLALAGGAANATITFILPSVFYLAHRWSDVSWTRLGITAFIILAAAAAAVIATVSAVQDLFSSSHDK